MFTSVDMREFFFFKSDPADLIDVCVCIYQQTPEIIQNGSRFLKRRITLSLLERVMFLFFSQTGFKRTMKSSEEQMVLGGSGSPLKHNFNFTHTHTHECLLSKYS